MSKAMVNDLIDQYQRSFKMLTEEISRFDERQWLTGLADPDHFQTPVVLAMHIYDCLDFYFCSKPSDEYHWGHRFGGGYWELPLEKLPSKSFVLAYAQELEVRVIAELSSLEDADLAQPASIPDESGETRLGRYIYALRHTIHHQGELAALNVFNGNQGGVWL
jgi:DinB superfamily